MINSALVLVIEIMTSLLDCPLVVILILGFFVLPLLFFAFNIFPTSSADKVGNTSFTRIMSRTRKVDLVFFYSPFSFLFSSLFDLFSIILFLKLGLGLEVTRSHCHTAGHKSHDAWKKVEGSRRMTSYNVGNTC